MGFVLVVGPSGAGKDTLIRLARAELAADPRYTFPKRLVTRAPSADEDNDEIDEAAFVQGEAGGRFALSWRAHGLGYALPAVAGRLALAGRIVVCNVSRRVVDEARARFPGTRVVAVTAPPEILARRLADRGRDADPAARLAREASVVPDCTVLNVDSPQAGTARLIALLRDQTASIAHGARPWRS